MKKLIFCVAALATALFAGSCQKENFEQAAGGKTVTYTVQLPDVATKAADTDRFIGDGKNVDQLIYEVWKTEAVEDAQLNSTDKTYLMFRKEADRNENGVFTFDLDLVNKQNYTILFWAQVKDAGHYRTTDLKNVQIVSNTYAFDESRAAFFGVDFIKASEPRKSKQTKTLTRPFGQINLATTLKTKEQLGYDLNVVETTVTVSRVASTFNVAAQKAVDSDQSYVFRVAAPDKNAETYVEKPITVKGTDYKWISMNYVFVPANQGLVDVDYTITTNHGAVENSISNIPAQVNYKTNIVGNLLTSKTEYIVDLNANWVGEYVHEVVTVASASDLQEAIDNAPEAATTATNIKIDVEPNDDGEKILDLNKAFVGLMSTKAGENAQKNYGIQIPANKSIVLDLNGCTIKQELECTAGYAMIENNGTLKIVGAGTLNFADLTTTLTKDPGYASNTIKNNGTLIVEDATIINSSTDNVANYGYPHCIDTNGELVINGGTLTNQTLYSTIRIWTSNKEPNKCKVTINGGTFNGSIDFQAHNNNNATIPHYGTLTINGGTFNATKDDSYAFRVLRFAVNVEDMVATINGGSFNGKVGVRDWTNSNNPSIISIVGGTFSVDPSEFVAPGYAGEYDSEKGTYTVAMMWYTDTDGNYHILNATGLKWVANEVNKFSNYEHPFEGVTLKLMNDIDLGGMEWTPIGDYRFSANRFCGTFDGQNHTISNFKITKKTDKNDSDKSSYGFFGNLEGTVKNLTIANATVNSYAYTGALVGRFNNGLIENCHVVDCNVSNTYWQGGILIGQVNAESDGVTAVVRNCSVASSSITSKSAIGAISGPVTAVKGGNITFENCEVVNCQIIQEGSFGGNFDKYFGTMFGYLEADATSRIDVNNCTAINTTVKGDSDAMFSGDNDGNVYFNGGVPVATSEDLAAAIKKGGNYILVADVAMTEATYQNVDFTLDGNGHTIRQAEGSTNKYGLFDSVTGKITLKNIVFDGVKGGAVLRTTAAELTMDNVTVKNCEHTQIYGLFRLIGKNVIKNCKFENNKCTTVITFNTEGDGNTDPQLVQNCEFKNNTCSATAVVHYSTGGSATFDGNKFVNNTLTVSNGATLYLGFKKNCTVTNNLFDGNTVTATSTRSSGGLMVGNAAVVTGNAFVNNTVTVNGQTGYGNDVCASPYYAAIDLSGNYWGGNAPVEGDDYYKEYNNYEVIINDYLTENPIK